MLGLVYGIALLIVAAIRREERRRAVRERAAGLPGPEPEDAQARGRRLEVLRARAAMLGWTGLGLMAASIALAAFAGGTPGGEIAAEISFYGGALANLACVFLACRLILAGGRALFPAILALSPWLVLLGLFGLSMMTSIHSG